MNRKDPKLTALQFNECINNQDADGLASAYQAEVGVPRGKITESQEAGKGRLSSVVPTYR